MATLTDADVAYVRSSYVTLEQLCVGRSESPHDVRESIARGRIPRPSYVLPDGTPMFPEDYFALRDDAGVSELMRVEFERRYRLAGGTEDVAQVWDDYLSGVYGVCLRQVTPETIARKGVLVEEIETLVAQPRAADGDWRLALRSRVDELDALERQFSPDHDRVAFGRPPTRDTLIRGVRERYPNVWGTLSPAA
jgi:uncharacterized protein DUF6058